MKRFVSLVTGAALMSAQLAIAQMGAPGERIPFDVGTARTAGREVQG